MPRPCRVSVVVAAVLATAGFDASAQVYKWVDENGVVNYSNTPPAKKPGMKPPVIVDETISVYTPEKAVTDSIEDTRRRSATPPPSPAPTTSATVDSGGNRVGVLAPPPAPPGATYDLCAVNPNDPRCQQVIYAPAPVIVPRRPVTIPAGTVTSNVGPSPAIVPGQPGLNNPQLPKPPSQGALMRGRDRDPDNRWR